MSVGDDLHPMSTQPGWSHCVWCEGCQQHHGPLFCCDTYAPARKAVVRAMAEQWRQKSQDPQWQAEQIRNGVPMEIVAINEVLSA